MKPVIIDVREPNEYTQSHVEGALNIPLAEVLAGSGAIKNLPRDGVYVVYCRSGARAEQAVAALKRMGFADVTNGINQEQVESS